MKKKRVVVYILGLIFFVIVAYLAWREIRIDSCLDRGGRWDYAISACVGAS